jgi:hypothetical protein
MKKYFEINIHDHSNQAAVAPPSIGRAIPFTKDDSSLAR